MTRFRLRRASTMFLAGALLLGVAGTSIAVASTAGAGTTSKAATITITNFMFQPMVLKVTPGEKITVTNKDTVDHTVTATDGKFNTGNIGHDKSKTFRAPTKPGTYHYICSIHQFMTGEIIVKK